MGAVITFLSSLFIAIADTKALAGYANAFFGNLLDWYVGKMSYEQKVQYADASVLLVAASTDEETFAALKQVKAAMQKPRIT